MNETLWTVYRHTNVIDDCNSDLYKVCTIEDIRPNS